MATIFYSLVLISIAVTCASSYQFQVGGKRGWIRPSKNNTEAYNEWASENRFHVGDSVFFKYQKDSVLVVNNADYNNCNISNPISKYENGSTIIRFDRNGFFYFISGQPGHCKLGQKMVVRVMAQSEVESPKSTPSPEAGKISTGVPPDDGGGGWDYDDWGLPSMNSTMNFPITSYFMSALAIVLVILYMFI